MKHRRLKLIALMELALICVCAANSAPAQEMARANETSPSASVTLKFHADRSLGRLIDLDSATSADVPPWWLAPYSVNEDSRDAKGDVSVPAGHRLGLIFNGDLNSDTDMLFLSQIQTLKSLSVNTTSITPAGFANLARLGALEELSLNWKGSDNGFASLSRLSHLKKLNIINNEIQESMASLVLFPALEELVCLNLENAAIRQIGRMPSLKRLALQGTGSYSPQEIAVVAGMPKLESFMTTWRISDDGLAYFRSLHSLRELTLSNGKHGNGVITDAGFAHLSEIKSLETIEIYYSGKCTDQSLAYLSEMPNLRRLMLPNISAITDAGLAHLAKSNSIEELYLSGNRAGAAITDKGLEHLQGAKSLRKLKFMTWKGIPEDAIARLAEKKPGLKILLGFKDKF